MNNEKLSINFSQARKIAEDNAFNSLGITSKHEIEILSTKYLEAEHCWMFFINESIQIKKENFLGIKWAHVVSKKGTYSMVQDFSHDQKNLHEYLLKMSEYFKQRNE